MKLVVITTYWKQFLRKITHRKSEKIRLKQIREMKIKVYTLRTLVAREEL